MNNLRDYNQKDYAQNPKKYSLFKTAKLKNSIFNQNGGVESETIVGLEFLCDKVNPLYKCSMPLYRLHTGDIVYGVNLKEFCL